MNFLNLVKLGLDDIRGTRGKAIVDRQALRELIEHFERLDSHARAMHAHDNSTRHKDSAYVLSTAIEAMYHQQGKNAETTLLVIMETLMPLMQQRQKESEKPRNELSRDRGMPPRIVF